MARINFNPENTRPFSGFSPIFPAGDYVVEIVNEQEHDFQSGSGRGLTFDYQIKDGEYKGGIIRDNLNLWHTSQRATEMAQARLVAIAHAVGVRSFMDTHELHRRPFVVRLSKAQYNGNERNQVDAYLALQTSPTTPSQAPSFTPPTNAAPAPSNQGNQPYWS